MQLTEKIFTSIVVFCLGYIAILNCILITWNISKKERGLLNSYEKWLITILFISWAITAIYWGHNNGVSVAGLFLVFTPIMGGTILSFYNPFKKILLYLPMHWLIYLQVYRIGGFIFIYLYLSSHLLTKGFALNASIGDMLTGIFALPIGYWVQRKKRYWKQAAVAWNLFGIADLIIAPISAGYFGAKGLNIFPLILIPIFIGPPLGTLLHICSLRNIHLQKTKIKLQS